ncbi:uncharacterized protein PG986_010636 [Apiospora aurea]|uniref:ZZ-type domain-containing protein n=1 Tax=Apiospora aurea TaxID=335848 RepID=A0ABR1Q2Y0_9PEZI
MSSTPDWEGYKLPPEPNQAPDGETTNASSAASDADSLLFDGFSSAIDWPETDPVVGHRTDHDAARTITQVDHVTTPGVRKMRVATNADRCWHCTHQIDQDYYHCTACGGMNICDICVGIGNHCKVKDHWLVKYHVEDGGHAVLSFRETIKTGWTLTRVKETTEAPFISSPKAELGEKKWKSSDKRLRASNVVFDYCHLCRVTFPIGEPPASHVEEEHGTESPPPEVPPQHYRKTPYEGPSHIWIKGPIEERAEERDEHKIKLAKMQTELQQYLDPRLAMEKRRLEDEEREMYQRYKEMKEILQQQVQYLEDKKAELAPNTTRKVKPSKIWRFFSKFC